MLNFPWRIHFRKRERPSRQLAILTPFAAVALALALAGLLGSLRGINPFEIYFGMIQGILQSRSGPAEVLVKYSPILLSSLGIALAFRASFWNIGGEGQIYMGAIFSFGAAMLVGGLPAWLAIPAVLLAGFLGGGLWGVIPALLKLRFSTNEIVTTLMMNYIAQYGLFYLVHGPWKMPEYMYPWSPPIPDVTVLPRLPGTRIHMGLLFGLIGLILVFVLVRYTVFGYEIRFVGANKDAARANGINVARTLIVMMIISGGLCGVAGMGEVAGLNLRLKEEISLGYGFTAITAALLGKLDPLGTAIGAFALAVLVVGGQYMQRTVSLPFSFIDIVTSLIVLLLLVGWLFSQYRLEFSLKKESG